MKKNSYGCIIAFCILSIVIASAQKQVLAGFPAHLSPLRTGKRVATLYVNAPFRNFDNAKTPPSEITYPESCAWFGALKFAEVTKDKELLLSLEERFLPLLGKQKELMQKPDHVDHTVFGVIPLQLYRQTGNKCYLCIGVDFAERQWQLPSRQADKESFQAYMNKGLSWQTRFWIDDMYMISAIQSQAYLASGEEKYIDRAARSMMAYLDSIQQPNGLFYHASGSPFFWCRGNGWMAAGMTELLKYLPEKHSCRNRILTEYQKMMNTLKQYQRPDGLWGQLVDEPEAWAETSGSAMFAYAMITGVKRGWLDKDFEPVARKAWVALLLRLDQNGEMTDVCQGTNAGHTKEYYLGRKRIAGDLHGQAPLLWCAAALLE